ncbi:MAG: ShlB/FhaC/HecB family hemolysin secretion/activation protein, partial [Candidatus Omnitrophica bacterium]|nr:ShlB/FhaC/HecB family hemolysin secretion/activation protein [Candidatus Omnitrophota bacterium]
KKGYITSFAYLPPQKIEEGVLHIQVVEGRLANVSVQGNRFFREALIRRGFHTSSGKAIYFPKLRRDLARLNTNPDRSVQAVLTPGPEKGTSDVILKVKDRFPIHPYGEWNNQGTAYTGRHKAIIGLIDNNFSTFDDITQAAVQLSQDMVGVAVTESFPLNSYGTRANFLYSFVRTAPKQDLSRYDVTGKSMTYTVSLTHPFFSEEKWGLGGTVAFDYKRSTTHLLGSEYSHDDPRIIRFGFDGNLTDPWGRNFFDQSFNWGLPEFMGGSGRENQDGARRGKGNNFFKTVTTYVRYQPVVQGVHIIQTLAAQFCHHGLMPSEEYYLGGATTVRGYTEGDSPGDQIFLTKTDLVFQLPFIDKSWKLPFAKSTLREQLAGVGFVDVGLAQLKHTSIYEDPYRKLIGVGVGIRMRFADDLYGRVEFGFPIGNCPDDHRGYQVHVSIRKELF